MLFQAVVCRPRDTYQRYEEFSYNTLTLHMLSLDKLCFMSNISFKGDILYRSSPSGVIDILTPLDSVKGG